VQRIGVVLFQLGGPDSLDAVEPFLYNLFLDPDIIDFPLAKLARPVLARLIAASRARKVRHHYQEIGGRSPIRELTQRQAAALEAELGRSLDARVVVAMRYWHPFSADAIRRLECDGVERLVLLPMYPQYSSTTTGSSLKEWRRRVALSPLESVSSTVIRDFYRHPAYLDALADQIRHSLAAFDPAEPPQLVFSAHNVPVSVIRAGDPYQAQIEETVRLLMRRGRWDLPAHLCYQSKVGGAVWLSPTLDETIRRLGAQGVRRLLVIPIAFVSDHVETLSEIDIHARQLASKCGIRQFAMMPGLNDSPAFIGALAELVESALGAAASSSLPETTCANPGWPVAE